MAAEDRNRGMSWLTPVLRDWRPSAVMAEDRNTCPPYYDLEVSVKLAAAIAVAEDRNPCPSSTYPARVTSGGRRPRWPRIATSPTYSHGLTRTAGGRRPQWPRIATPHHLPGGAGYRTGGHRSRWPRIATAPMLGH